MRIAVISDLHLRGFYSKNLANHLKKIYETHDEVIINGDFWEGYVISFNRFLRSKWASEIFPVMKEKTIYVYGNHDRKEWQDDRVAKFSKIAVESYRIQLEDGKELIIEHGHDHIFSFLDNLTRLRQVSFLFRPVRTFAYMIERAASRLLGWKAQNFSMLMNRKKQNERIMLSARKTLNPNEIYVASHTHAPMIDLENQYINTGAIMFKLSSYLRIENGDLEIIRENY